MKRQRESVKRQREREVGGAYHAEHAALRDVVGLLHDVREDQHYGCEHEHGAVRHRRGLVVALPSEKCVRLSFVHPLFHP